MAKQRVKYDLALSFAGEDRDIARKIADGVLALNYQVFFDEYEKAQLWGADLTAELGRIYGEDARFCVILISKHYAEKSWTNHERQFALARAMEDRRPYILPLRIDDTRLPGLPPTLGYLDLRNTDIAEVCKLLADKLGPPLQTKRQAAVGRRSDISVDRIREVLAACYRRAVFTRFHAQLDAQAMLDSLAECRSTLQRIVVFVEPEELQRLVAGIIGELDLIERIGKEPFTWNGLGTMGTIDGAKLRIINALVELSKAAKIPFVLPTSMTEEVFWSKEDADKPPEGPETDKY
jgi:TIR domain